ncbi:hypothetical protein B0T22DRAFT_19641 [Podospora appendiculata]|uniref:Uncharacterized protein n=1 Tax=Podospora appendiculata TaxID=314037 RepID=A0AAE0XFN9_9PEZI|nr:hypothetical protein B0T22DRAFT_19641 [Podospora appendiculata]
MNPSFVSDNNKRTRAPKPDIPVPRPGCCRPVVLFRLVSFPQPRIRAPAAFSPLDKTPDVQRNTTTTTNPVPSRIDTGMHNLAPRLVAHGQILRNTATSHTHQRGSQANKPHHCFSIANAIGCYSIDNNKPNPVHSHYLGPLRSAKKRNASYLVYAATATATASASINASRPRSPTSCLNLPALQAPHPYTHKRTTLPYLSTPPSYIS